MKHRNRLKPPSGDHSPLLPVLLFLFFLCPLWNAAYPQKTDLFPAMDGWQLSGNPATYTAANLYEYINGAAEAYLSYDFRELQVTEYRNDRNEFLLVEIYRFDSPADAFGIYSQERPAKGNYLRIGTQGYYEAGMLNFVKDRAYVKLNGYELADEQESILKSFAGEIAQNLPGSELLPVELNYFPKENKILNSEKYIARNFLGYPFFTTGFTAGYKMDGRDYSLFIISAKNSAQAAAMLKTYAEENGAPVRQIAPHYYPIKDKYLGSVWIFQKGRFLGGVTGLDNPAEAGEFLKNLKTNLPLTTP